MEKLLTFLAPLILAYYVAEKLAPAYDQSTSRKIAGVFEKVAGILLPLLILSIVRRMVISDELWLVTIVGFVVPVVFYLVVPGIAKMVGGPPVDGPANIANRMLFASFGGGNRGNLILVILAAAGAVPAEVTPHFVALDLGNLLCLVTLGFFLLARHSNAPSPQNIRLTQIAKYILTAPGFYAAILVALQLPGLREKDLGRYITTWDPTIQAVGDFLIPFFSFFVFLALFIRSEHLGTIIRKARPILRLFSAARLVPALVLFVAAMRFQSAFLASLAVLILMPPSSYLWGKISGLSDADDANYIVPNVFYFVVLAAAFLYGLLHL
jgi:hypothetical protein